MYSAVGNGGDNWIDTACMMTSLQNYEEQRGTAMGILKAQLGLSGAIFVMIYEVFLEPNVNQFLLLMSLVPTLAYVLLAFFVRPFDHTEDEDPSAPPRFKMAFITVLVLGIFMMVSLASKEYFKESKLLQLMTITIMLSIMLIMKFFPPSSEGIDLPKLETKAYDLQDAEEERLNLLKTGADPSQVLTHSQIATPAAASTGHTTLKDALADFNFWLVFLVVTIGAGTGVAIINNLAQIGKSLRAGGTDIYVGLISVWSCFGRLGSGYGSDLLMRRGYPRTLCLLIDQMIMALCCLLLATGLISSLFIGSALTGLSYGAYWTLIPAILSEVFGVQNFTVLYKLVSLGPPLGSYILSAKVMGSLYDEEAALYRQKSGGASVPAGGDDLNNCYGSKCFGFGLVALSLVSLVGAAASFLLFLGTKRAYHKNQVTYTFTTFKKLTDEQDCLRYTREAGDYVHNVGFVMKGLLPDVVAKAKKSAKCPQEEYRPLFYCARLKNMSRTRLELAIFLKVCRGSMNHELNLVFVNVSPKPRGPAVTSRLIFQALDEPGEKEEQFSPIPLSGNDKTKQNRVTYHKKNLCFWLQGLEIMKSWDGRGCGRHKHLAEQFAQFLGDNALVVKLSPMHLCSYQFILERHLNFNGVAGRNL
ncbi:hypothetical protein SELMODRAFT_445712 [Selaginella moellendorffii]|uniref:Uncharacterized protein n=1 Tax=Selaginella moellendorffii TaxID=88036 RepID=D8SKM9_SELML|nr:hypothetical protein SELMODRAFT_445712 [Selaginella moellendorffii]